MFGFFSRTERVWLLEVSKDQPVIADKWSSVAEL